MKLASVRVCVCVYRRVREEVCGGVRERGKETGRAFVSAAGFSGEQRS